MTSKFVSTLNKGIEMTFDNGLTISIQFGNGNYCSNRITGAYKSELKQDCTWSHSAEIAIWDENYIWFNFGGDEVKGYVSPNEVAKWINKVAKAKSIKSIRR